MKNILMQSVQLLLILLRISFLLYDIIKTIIRRVILYQRVGQILDGLDEEKLYTISVMLIAILLMLWIVFTFIYNYLIVHENFIGVLVMTILLVISFLLDLIRFGDNSFLESIIETVLSIVEIMLLFVLIFMIKIKRRKRYLKSFNQRFSLVSNV
jgi:hypothetical protein